MWHENGLNSRRKTKTDRDKAQLLNAFMVSISFSAHREERPEAYAGLVLSGCLFKSEIGNRTEPHQTKRFLLQGRPAMRAQPSACVRAAHGGRCGARAMGLLFCTWWSYVT